MAPSNQFWHPRVCKIRSARTPANPMARLATALSLIVGLLFAQPASATFHLWTLTEIFSNADGTIQYMMFETSTQGQEFLWDHTIRAAQGDSAHSFVFPGDLPADSAGHNFLVATQGFADLGVLTPDYVVPNGFLFLPNGGVALLGCANCTADYTNLPTDGLHATTRFGGVVINEPMNFAGKTTRLSLPPSSVTVDLLPGWNLAGNSNNAALDVTATFADTSKVTSVWKWLPTDNKWAFFAPSMDAATLGTYATGKGYAALSSIGAGEGFWVNAKLAFATSLPTATAVSASRFIGTLTAGWSLIATGDGLTPRAFNNALSSTPPVAGTVASPNLTTLWVWDSTNANWYFYAPALDNSASLPAYTASKGYLDFGSRALNPGQGFWINRP